MAMRQCALTAAAVRAAMMEMVANAGCKCGELRGVALAAAVNRCFDVFRLPPKVDTGRRSKDL